MESSGFLTFELQASRAHHSYVAPFPSLSLYRTKSPPLFVLNLSTRPSPSPIVIYVALWASSACSSRRMLSPKNSSLLSPYCLPCFTRVFVFSLRAPSMFYYCWGVCLTIFNLFNPHSLCRVRHSCSLWVAWRDDVALVYQVEGAGARERQHASVSSVYPTDQQGCVPSWMQAWRDFSESELNAEVLSGGHVMPVAGHGAAVDMHARLLCALTSQCRWGYGGCTQCDYQGGAGGPVYF